MLYALVMEIDYDHVEIYKTNIGYAKTLDVAQKFIDKMRTVPEEELIVMGRKLGVLSRPRSLRSISFKYEILYPLESYEKLLESSNE